MTDDTRPLMTPSLFGEALDRIAKPPKAPTRSQRKRIEGAAAIRLTEPDDAEVAFMARALVMCTLPHRDPGDVPQWARTSGKVTLGIQPGRDFKRDVSIGYPYGSLPRLLLFWLCSEAVRTGQRRLLLGETCTDFMKVIGLNTDGGRDARRFRNQARRLFAASIMVQDTSAQRDEWVDLKVAPKGVLWWDARPPSQAGLYESWIELGGPFFEAITTLPIPVDLRALRILKQSPLALDVYALSTYKTFVAQKKDAPQLVKWRWLVDQFGTDVADRKNLKRKITATLTDVGLAFPGLHVTFVDGGFLIHPSKPAIAPAARRRP